MSTVTAIKSSTLPNGQVVFYRSRVDLDLLSRELLTEDHAYLRHGIAIDDGDCIFDVGANIGFFLLSLQRRLRSGRVFAFEPIPQVFEVLRKNAASLDQLELHLLPCGLSSSAGEATFDYFPRTSVLSTMRPDLSPEFRRDSRRFVLDEIRSRSAVGRAVAAVTPEFLWYPLTESIRRHYHVTERVACRLRTLSEIVDEYAVERIDLLKIDTEGAEEDVLAGLRPGHWDRVRQVVVEVHRGREELARMEALLAGRGFVTVSEPVFPGVDNPNVVFARRA
mgnify:CR=1 FL=1